MTSAGPATIVPVDLLDPGSLSLAEQWLAVYAADQRELFGDEGSTWQLAEVQGFHRNPDRRRAAFVALDDEGAAVGALEVAESLRDNLDTANLSLAVHPDHRRRGIGSALLEQAERVALADGRHVLMAGSEFVVGGVDSAETFATARGWSVGQTAPRGKLSLPGDEAWRERLVVIREGGDVATTAQPSAYRVETSRDLPPEAWLPGMAEMYRRMSTDMPLGDLAIEEEEWDAERVRRVLDGLLAAGRRLLTSAAFDATGRMVGFTELGVSSGTPHLAYQGATLVLREHRGHRIGLRLKAANALALLHHLPDVRSIRTWNADDNAPMLAVNRELGFVVDAYERNWQKRLS